MFLALAAACALVPVLRAGSAAAASGASLENVAVAPTGDAVAIWTENLGANSFVQAAARPPGSSWQAPVNLSAPGAGIAEVAIGPTGDAVAVWLRFNGTNGIVQAAARPAGGAWQPPIDLSAPDRNAAYPRVAVGSGGRRIRRVGEQPRNGQRGGAGGCRGPRAGPGSRRSICRPPAACYDSPRVANDSAGDAVAVWGWHDRSDTGNEVVQAATRPARGGWRAPVTLSPAGHYADFPSVAMNPAGVAYAVWRDPAGSGFVQAAARPAGGVWQPPVTLSTADWNSWEPQVALNAAGDAVAVWEATPAGGLPTEDHAVVQAAARSAHAGTRFWQAPVNLSAPGPTGSPEAALDPAGDAVAVWEDYDPSSSNDVVRAATRPAASGAWQAPIMLSAADQNNSFSPQIALDSGRRRARRVAVRRRILTSPAPRGRRRAQPPAGRLAGPGRHISRRLRRDRARARRPRAGLKRFAGPQVTAAGLVARSTGATTATVSYVATETPAPDTRVARGSIVTMYLKPGSPPLKRAVGSMKAYAIAFLARAPRPPIPRRLGRARGPFRRARRRTQLVSRSEQRR